MKKVQKVDFVMKKKVQKRIELPKYLWDATDGKQFEWFDEAIGGRTQNHWAYRPGGR